MTNTYNIYVAGSWDERVRIGEIMRILEANNHHVMVNWIAHDGPESTSYAHADRLGVFQCDVFVFCNPWLLSRGKYIELGMAIALRKPIICTGTEPIGIFEHLGVIKHVNTIDELLNLLSTKLPDVYGNAPSYTAECKNCNESFILNFKGETGIVDCPKCRHPIFFISYESSKKYKYVAECDTPGWDKMVREEVREEVTVGTENTVMIAHRPSVVTEARQKTKIDIRNDPERAFVVMNLLVDEIERYKYKSGEKQ